MSTESGLDLEQLGRFLLERRGGMARREFAEKVGVAHTYLKKMEDGGANVSLATLVKVARGGEFSLIKILDAAVNFDKGEVEQWALENTDVRANIEKEVGGRVVVEAKLPSELEEVMRGTASDVALVLKALEEHAAEGLGGIHKLVQKLQSLMVTAASISAAMERQWEVRAPPPVLGGPSRHSGEEVGQVVGSVGAVEGDDSAPG